LGEGQHTVTYGTPVPPEQEEATEKTAVPKFNSDGVQARMSHLMLADTAPEHWFEGKADPRQWGSALHRVLQHSSAQQDRALERLYRSGKFSEALHAEAEAVLRSMEDRKELGPIQQNSTIVYVERTVANKAKVLRPDLIMSTESEVRIVDYKTGQEKPAHQKQVEEYAEALGNVFASVETSIVYL
jgi:ATP-dependent exoDNAse (exonuclease V) beta subunit